MNQQEQSTKRAAIFQDTINGTNDPTPWPVTMWPRPATRYGRPARRGRPARTRWA